MLKLKHKILVIDDEPGIMELIENVLEHEGYEILSASNGQEGLKLYFEHQPILVILDLMMPVMNGLQFLDSIQLTPLDSSSVIVITGHGSDNEIEQCFKKGVSAFIRKPFSIYALNGLVRNTIALKEALIERKLAEIALQNAHDELEQKVNRRTADIVQINEQLKQEIEERICIETALEKARDAAEAGNRAKIEFISNMSHELRTPLNAILGFVQILKTHKNLTHMQKDHLSIVWDSGEHLLSLINDILEVSKTGNRETIIEPRVFNLASVVNIAFNITRFKADEKDLLFQHKEDSLLPESVTGDERKLTQILLNLLTNAVKYTHKGSVTLSTSYDLETGRFRAEVSDTGVGIYQEYFVKIFDPFFRYSNEPGFLNGSGLGLSITRKFIDLMNGTISVNSKVNEGSTFTVEVELPSAQAVNPVETKKAQQIMGYKGEQKKVLVVDDNFTNLYVLVNLLETLGFNVTAADKGQAALKKAIDSPPDMILLDFIMPEMDGIDVIMEIKKINSLQDVKIIGISAAVPDNNQVQKFTEMCDDFLLKPVKNNMLLEKMKFHMGLEWEVEETETEEIQEKTVEKIEKIPPDEVLEQICEAAMAGRVKNLETLVNKLDEEDISYKGFCSRVRQYLENYDWPLILKYISPNIN